MRRLHRIYSIRKIMFIPLIGILGLWGAMACTEKDDESIPAVIPIEDKAWVFSKEPIWADEFENAGKPDPDKWEYEIGNSGWGNK